MTSNGSLKDKRQQIDVRKVVSAIWRYRKLYLKVLSIVFVASCVYIFPIPRTYTCSVMLAPEMNGANAEGSLSSLASSFGVNLNGAMSQDAISPTLYPDLIGSTNFTVSLFPVQVVTEEDELTTNYYDYMSRHQRRSIWVVPFSWVKSRVVVMFERDEQVPFTGTDAVDVFRLSKRQQEVVEAISKNINCTVDKKTDVITITVTDQDPLVCASIADTVRVRLQAFITDYRTSKARIDLDYYQQLTDKAKAEYDQALQVYGKYADAHKNVILESYRLEQADLENDMQIKFNTYTAMNTQLQAARAKVQERTPAFTTLQCATVPVKPTGPKRVFFVFGMLCLAFFVTSCYVLNKIVKN